MGAESFGLAIASNMPRVGLIPESSRPTLPDAVAVTGPGNANGTGDANADPVKEDSQP